LLTSLLQLLKAGLGPPKVTSLEANLQVRCLLHALRQQCQSIEKKLKTPTKKSHPSVDGDADAAVGARSSNWIE